MTSDAKTPEEYISALPKERREAITKLRNVILKNIPKGFEETMGYGMIGYVVPHTIYPDGYHCNPKLPLPFMSLASQKNYIAIYHSGIYAKQDLFDWFVKEYPKYSKNKLDMGKSCVRFKKIEDIPYKLIEKLVGKLTAAEWIETYEKVIKN